MHILGIYLYDGDKSVIKNLQPNTWYPLYDLKNFNTEPSLTEYNEKENFYKLDESDTTKISVSCIVGQNGSGKSTLLDILYRIINDFSWHIKQSNDNLPTKIYYAYGFHARLYFEVNSKIGYIEIVATDKDKKHRQDCINWDNHNQIQFFGAKGFNLEKLNDFFYTIVTNYSLYSFSPEDYNYETSYFTNTEDDKEFYPSGIFNKNDAYITPIVLLPYRKENGSIITDNEKNLATQRILALSLFLYKNYSTSLIDNKMPEKIMYSFNSSYEIDSDTYKENPEIIDKLSNLWHQYFHNELLVFDYEIKSMILLYLGYKTYKFVKRYGFFNENFNITEKKKIDILNNFGKEHIVRILYDESFMTLKIRQTCNFIKQVFNNTIDQRTGEIIIKDKFNENDNDKDFSIDDYFLQLPPTFYNCDLFFSDNNQLSGNKPFSLNTMSSGEKQILYNLSYILYHLKNLSTKNKELSNTSLNATPEYKNAVLVFDEAELYLHPELQRKYIFEIISSIQKCHFEKIQDIHIIFATHSPYLLSDVPSNNVLMLEDGKIRNSNFSTQTFSANIYDLLKYQFFMTSPVGEFARVKIQRIIQMLEDNENLSNEEYLEIKNFIKTIGDDYIRKTLESLLKEHQRKFPGDDR